MSRDRNKEIKVMIAGHLCLDISPKFPDSAKLNISEVFAPGRLTNIEDAVLSTGGAVPNTGLTLAKLGTDVILNGKVGDDAFGDIIRQIVGEERAKSFKMVSDQKTSYTIVLAPPGIDRFVLHNPATNDSFGPEDIDYKLAEECAIFHFGYPPLMKRMFENDGTELAEIFQRIKKLGVITSLDMAMPDPDSGSGQVDWLKILEKNLPFVDIFAPSIEEITFMVDRTLFNKRKVQAGDKDPVIVYKPQDCTKISTRLLALGAKVIMIKCGEKGLYLRTASLERLKTMLPSFPMDFSTWANREIWSGAFKLENYQSALGAGDATIAGFLNGILKSFSPQDALQIACALGWQNVQAMDALGGIKDWKTTLKIINDKVRLRNPLKTDTNEWRFSDAEQIYYGPNDISKSDRG
ncbi:carbohydrate kinase family protein [Bacteroidota bacterium]